jgi:hypothetical protein
MPGLIAGLIGCGLNAPVMPPRGRPANRLTRLGELHDATFGLSSHRQLGTAPLFPPVRVPAGGRH